MTPPLIAFVHVPKTAGVTVIAALDALSHRGANLHQRGAARLAKDELATLDWVSGHIDRQEFSRLLTWVARPIEYFSVVRHPKSRIISHLNYSIHRTTLPDYLSTHGPDEQLVDHTVACTALDNPAELKRLLLSYPDLFLNIQSRYILGSDFDQIGEEEVSLRLSSYKYIGTEYTLPQLFQMFGFARVPSSLCDLRSNVSGAHFDSHIFDTPAMESFLSHHLSHDYRLYRMVGEAFHNCPPRMPIRSAYISEDILSEDDFDGESYLRENADVALSVERGEVESALSHFQRYGRSEGRRQRKEFPAV